MLIRPHSDIQDRAKKTYESLPQFCKFRDEQIDDVELPMDTLYARLLIRLEYLQCLLFAARLITRHGGTDDGTLLFVSFEIVRHVLVFWMNMDRFDGVRVDFLWMVRTPRSLSLRYSALVALFLADDPASDG